jgi:hypothetical protein
MTKSLASNANENNPLLSAFIANGGRCIHKWVDYFEIYHRAFERYRNKPITFVEIGVQNGGSTQMWREYFGPQAKIIGVDIDPACKALEAEGFEIWIGDQGDPKFWSGFLKEHPNLDIVLDDGGHTMRQQIVTFGSLFPALNERGTYLCEDTSTSYFPKHGGGLKKEGTFHEMVKNLIDDMHAWWHSPLSAIPDNYIANHLYSLCVYDSVVVMEKRKKNAPLVLARGNNGHKANPPAMTHVDMRRAFGVKD